MVVETDVEVYPHIMISAAQIRAARALIDWKQSDLAENTGLALVSIKKIERGESDPKASSLRAIQGAFARAGVLFIEEGDTRDGGAGVRLKSGS